MRLPVIALAALAGFLVPAGAADLFPKELAAARKLNLVKCSKCHKIYEPKDYTVADWDVWIEKMARKSKLKPQQTALLNQYFALQRAGEVPPDRRAPK